MMLKMQRWVLTRVPKAQIALQQKDYEQCTMIHDVVPNFLLGRNIIFKLIYVTDPETADLNMGVSLAPLI